MIKLESILEIVDTYQLTDNSRDIILRNTLKRQPHFEDYAAAYTYIANFVEYLQTPFQERRHIRLDAVIGDSDTTFAHFFGKEDNIVFEKDEQYRREKILEHSTQYLGERLDDQSLDFFNTLILNSGLEPEEYKAVIESVDEDSFSEIARRLDILKTGMYDKDQDSISRGDLEVVSFNPFKIRFKNRKYEGNPLKFFRDNKELYEGMSRKDLERFDSGLARHLRYHSQIEEAIPETKITNSLPEKEVQKIIDSYEESYGCPKLAQEKLGFHRETIKKYWRQEGLKLYSIPYRFKEDPLRYFQRNKHKFKGMSRSELMKQHPGFYNYLRECGQLDDAIPEVKSPKKLSKNEVKEIIRLYKTVKGSLAEAQRITGHSTPTISRYWQEAGLHEVKAARVYNGNPLAYFYEHRDRYEGMSRGELAIFDQGLYQSLLNHRQIDEAIPKRNDPPKIKKKGLENILKSYVPCEGVANRASEMTGFHSSTIIKYWNLAGLEAQGQTLTDSEIAEIVNSYKKYDGHIINAAKSLGRARPTVAKYWRDAGLEPKHSKVFNDDDKIQRIVNAYETYDGHAENAAKALGFTTQTVLRYWRRNNLKVNPPGRNIPEEAKQEILDAFEKFDGKASVAAKALGRDYGTIIKHWDNAGFERKKKPRKK